MVKFIINFIDLISYFYYSLVDVYGVVFGVFEYHTAYCTNKDWYFAVSVSVWYLQ
jgi:hypothetical protein